MMIERQAMAAQRLEDRLAYWLGSQAGAGTPERLAAALRHATLGGGKRFRPFLVLETAALFGASEAAALDVATALECIHCYSLVHDDLPAMDNDRLRRGKPTVWAAFDEWTGILAGDALLTLGFEIIASLDSLVEARTALELSRLLARDAGRIGMVGGQVLDLEAEKLGQPANPTLAHVNRLHSMKTGALIRFACEAGAVLGGASPSDRKALVDYGANLGVAFQISDDLLDVEGDAALVGKAVGKDAALGKATSVSLSGVDAARAELDRVVAQAVNALQPFADRAQTLREAAYMMVTRKS